MARECGWFDRYRDGELSPAQIADFEAHVAGCDGCRTKTLLLNRLVLALEREEAGSPVASPNSIAARACASPPSWDDVLVSWLKPAPAWSAVAVLLVLFALIWRAPGPQQPGTAWEFETLMSQGDQAGTVGGPSGSLTDEDLERWLGQRGNAQ